MRTILKSFLILMILTEAMCQSKRDKKMKKRVPGRNRKTQHRIKDDYVVIGQVPSFPLSSVGHPLFQTGDPTSVPQHNQRSPEDMKLHFVKNTLVTCNDGTTAGYYLREAKGSKRWIIFLEGGWCCYSKETCDFRYKNARRLMSSSEWPPTRKEPERGKHVEHNITTSGSGILSPKQHENPHWWNLNAVFVPYCSSDVWSGNVSKSHNDYAFMGSIIIQEVIRDLVPKGIKHAKVIILAGSSAGGTGVLVNIDRVATLMEELTADSVQVRGLVDSGWFIDPKKTKQSDCLDGTACAVTDTIKNGLRLWNGILPEQCKQQYMSEDEWQCFYGPKLYTSLKSPIFVVQWLYDEEQLRIENIQPEFQSMNVNQWNNIQNIGQELKKSLHNIPAVFAPACFSHTLITKSNWLEFQVKSVSLARALHCWEKSLQEKRGQKAGTRACSFHLIDTCEWPHCNPTCPAIHNRVSGKEIDMLQMVLRLGIDNQGKGQESKGELSRLMAMLRNGG